MCSILVDVVIVGVPGCPRYNESISVVDVIVGAIRSGIPGVVGVISGRDLVAPIVFVIVGIHRLRGSCPR